jgi:two-component system LytT family response regulator
VTAYDRYAVKAFDARAVDYLLKPYKRQRFFEALERAKEQRQEPADADYDRRLAELARQLRPSPERLVVRTAGRICFLRAQDIQWIEAAANYVRLHTRNEVHVMREKIGVLEAQLDRRRFLRIHRSIIVNVDEVKELQSCGGGEYVVVMRNGKELPFGRTHRDQLESFMLGKEN